MTEKQPDILDGLDGNVILRGWENIGRHIGVSGKTAQRWKKHGLPHRHFPGGGGVWCLVSELRIFLYVYGELKKGKSKEEIMEVIRCE